MTKLKKIEKIESPERKDFFSSPHEIVGTKVIQYSKPPKIAVEKVLWDKINELVNAINKLNKLK